jgi:hypothetical protein
MRALSARSSFTLAGFQPVSPSWRAQTVNGSPSYTPYEFLDSLKRDEIRRPLVLYGMVKPAEDDDEYLLFAQGPICANWTRIRLTSIESVEFLNFVPCDDHTHPLVVLYLKQPETDEGRLLASLFPATSARTPGRAPTLIRGPRSSPGRRPQVRVVERRGSERPVPTRPLARSAPRGCNDYEIDADGIWTFVGVSEDGDCMYELTDPIATTPGF